MKLESDKRGMGKLRRTRLRRNPEARKGGGLADRGRVAAKSRRKKRGGDIDLDPLLNLTPKDWRLG